MSLYASLKILAIFTAVVILRGQSVREEVYLGIGDPDCGAENNTTNLESCTTVSPDVPSALQQKRSINGYDVNALDYQFVVRLHDADHLSFCGGSVINKRLVLTAAHCISNRLSHVAVSSSDGPSKVCHGIVRYISHPRYNTKDGLHDLGLLVLKNHIQDYSPIRLIPKGWNVRKGATASAFGWGFTEYGDLSANLRRVDLLVLNVAECIDAYQSRGNWICTDSHVNDICNGDSGGPLLVHRYQVGIVSIGDEKCESGVPSAFTAVAAYRDWIDWYSKRYH
ncbi:hypothetical protein QAD02_003805 [Eretmocerus hayati]|uniref:Uncharacterized protein n=1 Tax=Eretmocerus hayati TaxID=131215 RepID=A0ACC2NN27_9HYME|nr:hypothetical protein QAD02_003805 [Eretmocerus hayati]